MTGLLERFLSTADRLAALPALHWNGCDLTYSELRTEMERQMLLLEGIPAGAPVCIAAHKNPSTLGLVFACLELERPFLLLAPTLAAATFEQVSARSGCAHIIDAGAGTVRTQRADFPKIPDDVRFMLATSGSTGLPKVVPIRQGAVDRFIEWAANVFDIRPARTVLNLAPLNFDLCFLDVWTTLAYGGRVVLADPDQAAKGSYLLDLVHRFDVHVIQGVPMFFTLMAAAGEEGRFHAVDHIMFTGDAITELTVYATMRLFPNSRLHNIYGCTETNDSFMYEVDRTAVAYPLPIGAPLPGVNAVVMSDDGAVVDGAGTGELLIAGPYLTPGYLDPSRNTGRFTEIRGTTYFRSGDLVQRDEARTIRLIGRSDFQVKVRGVAINTAEVETVLGDHPLVRAAAVVALPDPLTGRTLTAVVQRQRGSSLSSFALKKHCAQNLPKSAIPTLLYVTDEQLPLTSTGKINRRQAIEDCTPNVERRVS
ncbi:AMP-binding protein [Arthrobacter sp. H5]|uniref:AMP-binding protein n=1 Tax=Arthrobacter sp. H5 TaxID=1267973 RepID=UPI0004ACBD56|nr:AMP-binding protein [Arthrobacter sp. H5]